MSIFVGFILVEGWQKCWPFCCFMEEYGVAQVKENVFSKEHASAQRKVPGIIKKSCPTLGQPISMINAYEAIQNAISGNPDFIFE